MASSVGQIGRPLEIKKKIKRARGKHWPLTLADRSNTAKPAHPTVGLNSLIERNDLNPRT